MSKAFFTQGGHIVHGDGSPVSGGSFTIIDPPSTDIKVDTNFVYKGPVLNVSFSGGNMSGMVPGSVAGVGVIPATALNNFEIPSIALMRDGDTGTLVGTGTPVAGPPPVPVSIPCKCVDSQTLVKGD